MPITKEALSRAYAEHGSKYEGVKEDYFGALYLADEFGKPIADIAHQVAFGGRDYGVDAFHVDPIRRNLYLFQFKWSTDHQLFKESFKRLISHGMDRVFGNPLQDNLQNAVLDHLKARLYEDQALIERVFIRFVFNGDPKAAEQSAVLDSLREDLEMKKHLIDAFFGREVSLTIEYHSNETKKPRPPRPKKTHKYDIAFPAPVSSVPTETGEQLHVSFVTLLELHDMYKEMGQRLFDRNIRAGLSGERPVNKALRGALKDVLEGKVSPHDFAFMHNGVTLFAEKVEFAGERAILTEPRVLNGAQTITSVGRFLEMNEGNKALQSEAARLRAIRVMAKIVSGGEQDFITRVTINTNRQNPVEPVNLRASDPIQLELQDRFREKLSIFYERQDNAFANLSDDDLADLGIDQYKAIQIRRLAQTFLAAQGEIDRMSRLNDVFEAEVQYSACFHPKYLKSDPRRILLAYKVHMRLKRYAQEIVEKGGSNYAFADRAKNLIWALLIQGVLNNAKLTHWLDAYGETLTMEADFSEVLKAIASSKIRFILKDATADEKYQQLLDDEKYSFLRTKAMYLRCMEIASDRYGWERLSL